MFCRGKGRLSIEAVFYFFSFYSFTKFNEVIETTIDFWIKKEEYISNLRGIDAEDNK